MKRTLTDIDFVQSISEFLNREINIEEPLRDQGIDSFSAVQLQRYLGDELEILIPLNELMGPATLSDTFTKCTQATRSQTTPARTSSKNAAHAADYPDQGPWPLTPVQSAYWVGRGDDYPLGGVSARFYQEFHVPIPESETVTAFIQRLETAWNEVVRQHPILHTVITRDGVQEELKDYPLHKISVYKPDPRQPEALLGIGDSPATTFHELSHQCPPLDQWPIHTIAAVIEDDAPLVRLCVGFDVILLDLPSIMRVLHEWGQALQNPGSLAEAEAGNSFGQKILLRQADPRYQGRVKRCQQWWQERIHEIPSGPFPIEILAETKPTAPPIFKRYETRIPNETWTAIRRLSNARKHSASIVLAAAFACALRLWGANDRFALNTTVFDPEGIAPKSPIGDYTRTSLLDMRACPAGTTFHQYVKEVSPHYWQAIDHADIPVHEILRIRNHATTSTTTTVQNTDWVEYGIVFTSAIATDLSSTWLGTPSYCISQTPQVILDAIHYESNGELVLAWDAAEGYVPHRLIKGIQHTASALLKALAEDEPWDDPALLADPWVRQQHRVSVKPFWEPRSIAAGFTHTSTNRRIITPQGTVTSDDIQRFTNEAAASIINALGATASPQPILVAMKKSARQVTAVLGIIHTGHSYIPVDPAWPSERINRIVQRSGAKFAFADDSVELPAEVKTLTQISSVETVPTRDVQPTDLAYTIFTSGSTGEPKGVAIEHGQARTTIDEINHRFGITHKDTVFGISALSFDLSVWDIFGVLGAGGSLALPDPTLAKDPQHWLDVIRATASTVWNSAPPLMEMLVEYSELNPEDAAIALSSLRLILLSGDWIPVTLPERIQKLAPQARVISLGGATEASIWSLCFDATGFDCNAPSVPYGTALKGQWFRILNDEATAIVPPGKPGHLYIGGNGVARGYLGDKAQTEKRFIYHHQFDERLYNTGDMGMWLDDGTIRFLGRDDRQVKINGFRIELGDIDAALTRNPQLRMGMCAAPNGPDGRLKLVAYVVPNAESSFDQQALRTELRSQLPEYMVPSYIVAVPRLPITDNGKIDYRNLPLPWEKTSDAHSELTQNTEDPQNHETTPVPSAPDLVSILQALDPLSTPLAAGLDSLTLVRVANAIEDRSGQRPRAASLLNKTIAELIAKVTVQTAPTERSTTLFTTADQRQTPSPAPVLPKTDALMSITPQDADLLTQALNFGATITTTIPAFGSSTLSKHLGAVSLWLQQLEAHNIEYLATRNESADQLYTVTLSPTSIEAAQTSQQLNIIDAPASAPLTELQLAYYLGRADNWLGQPVAPFYYTEVDCSFSQYELTQALDLLVATHPALCLGVQSNGSQRLDHRCTPTIEVTDLRNATPEQRAEKLAQLRSKLRRGTLRPEGKPWLKLHLSLLEANLNRLHLGIDMLFCDVLGAQLLAEQLQRTLQGKPLLSETQSFLDYAQLTQSTTSESSKQETLRHNTVNIPFNPHTDTTFARKTLRFSKDTLQTLRTWSTEHASTLDATIITAISFAAANASRSPLPSVVTTVLQRPRGHENTIGEYTSTLIVDFEDDPTIPFEVHAQRSSNNLIASVLDNDQSEHGNAVIRHARTSLGSEARFPLVYSSGFAAGSNTSELLSALGTTVFAISETPQVLVDVQSYFDNEEIVLNIDYPEKVVASDWMVAFLAKLEEWLTTLSAKNHEPQAANPSDQIELSDLRNIVAQLLGRAIEPHEDSVRFFDLGLSSIDLVALHTELAQKYHIDLSVLDLFAQPSIQALFVSLSNAPSHTRATQRGAHRRAIAASFA